MIKKILIMAIIAFVAITGSVFAYQNARSSQMPHERGQFHEGVEKILEEGTYEDLISFREEVGFDVMRRVQSEEDFEAQKERHELRETRGLEPGYKRAGKFHRGYGSGCPMAD